MKHAYRTIGVAIAFFIVCAVRAECPRYEVAATLGTAGFEPFFNQPTDLSEKGYVAGYLLDHLGNSNKPYVWWGKGDIELIPIPPGTRGQATGVNDHGQVVGWVEGPAFGGSVGFIYDRETRETTIVEQPAGYARLEFAGINANGLIIGSRGFGPEIGAIAWEHGRWLVDPLIRDTIPTVRDVNDSGVAVGSVYGGDAQRAHVWDIESGNTYQLPAIPGGLRSNAHAINNQGVITGSGRISTSPLVARTFVWRDNQMIDLGAFADYRIVVGSDVNDSDQIVGGLTASDTLPHSAFLWEHGQMYEVSWITVGLLTDVVGGLINNESAIVLVGPATNSTVLRRVSAAPGDVTCDQLVGFDDLVEVLSNWGPGCTGGCNPDLDEDRVVGTNDLMLILENWD